jgi:hypothetical protein
MAKKEAAEVTTEKKQTIVIAPAKLHVLPLLIEGESVYVQNKFSEKARAQIEATQRGGSTEKSKGKKRDPKDFEENWRQAMHIGIDGRHGIPASSFRLACISACRLVGFKMTLAKLAIFTLSDTTERDGTPLVHIISKPRALADTPILPVRNDNGSVDLRLRPMWDPGWRAKLRIRFDADVFTATDVANMIERVGQQVGIGEGRHDSKNSGGQGWGVFRIVG